MQNDIGILIKHLNEQIEKEANQLLKQHGLTIAQMRIIEHLYLHQEKPVTQKELETCLSIAHPTTVGTLRRLEDKGMITTCLIREGKMSKTVCLTKMGEEAYVSGKVTASEIESKMQRVLTEEERKNLPDILIRLRKSLAEGEK